MSKVMTFTLQNGCRVYRSAGASMLFTVDDDGDDGFTMADLRTIHGMATRLLQDPAVGAIHREDIEVTVFAPGQTIPASWTVSDTEAQNARN